MKLTSAILIFAISSTMAMQIRPKRQTNQNGDSTDLENRYGWQRSVQGSQWNQFPAQGQNFLGQGQLTSQYPGFTGQVQIPSQGQNYYPVKGQLPRSYPGFPGQAPVPGQGQTYFTGQGQLPNPYPGFSGQGQFPGQGHIYGQNQYPYQFPTYGRFPEQGQFSGHNQLTGQSQYPGQGQIPGQFQFPSQGQFGFPVPGQGQLAGQQSTTPSPDNNGISDNAREQQIQQCITNCRVTTEHNPVCGTDLVQYSNPGRLECAKACGGNVSLLVASPCPTTTTTTTTVAPSQLE